MAHGAKEQHDQEASYASIAIAKGMHHREIQVSHGRPNDSGCCLGLIQAFDKLIHQIGNEINVGSLVDDFIRLLVVDENGSSPP